MIRCNSILSSKYLIMRGLVFLSFVLCFPSGLCSQVIKSSTTSKTTEVRRSKSNHQRLKSHTTVRNVILMIGDGMGLSQITAGQIAKRDALHLAQCQAIGLSKTHSFDNLITDSAAGATAFSIGEKTYNGAIGLSLDTNIVETILETAENNGYATGLVATSSITHATPASFIAHKPSRYLDEAIAADFLQTDIDVFIGGGKKYFSERKDGKDLVKALGKKDYQVVDGIENIEKIKKGKLAGFTHEEHPPKMTEGRGDLLKRASLTALNILDKNEKGFFLMIEGSQIDWGGHAKDSQYIIKEMLDFDEAIGVVLDYARKDGNTLVIITADHETGGYALTGGDLEKGTVKGEFVYDKHTATMVPVFAYGPGAEAFIGIYENTEIYTKMMHALGLER